MARGVNGHITQCTSPVFSVSAGFQLRVVETEISLWAHEAQGGLLRVLTYLLT